MSTQEEVAKKAGVSFITVSRVINGKGYVKKETREKVLSAIKDLNYYANHIGQALRGKTVNTIGIIIPEPPNVPVHGMEYYNLLMQGIDRSTVAHKYDILLSTYKQDDSNVDYFRLYFKRKVDGLILFIPDMRYLKTDEIEKRNIPCVIIGECPAGKNISYVDTENFEGMYMVAEYLISRGFRRIGFIKGRPFMQNSADRYEGFLSAMKNHGLRVDMNIVFEGDFTSISGQNAIRAIVSSGKLPDALICSNDLMALGALAEAKKNNIRIPESLALIGFDDISITVFTDPPISTVRQPLFDMGFTASEFLFSKIQYPEMPAKSMIFPVELIIRKSA